MCGVAVGPDNGPGAGRTAVGRMADRAADARNGGPRDSRCPKGAGEEGGGNAAASGYAPRGPDRHRGPLDLEPVPHPRPAAESFSEIVLASPSEFPYSTCSHGGVAQLGERLTGSQEVRGSIPLVSTTVNAEPPGIRRLFSYAATAQTKVTPHQHPHPKKLRNLFPTSVHSLLTQHNSFLHFSRSALQLERCAPTVTPA